MKKSISDEEKAKLLKDAYEDLQRDFPNIASQYRDLQNEGNEIGFSNVIRVLSALPEEKAELKSNLLRPLADAIRANDNKATAAMIDYKYDRKTVARNALKAFSKDIYRQYTQAVIKGNIENLASILHNLYKSENIPEDLLELKDSLYNPLVEKERQIELDAIAKNQEDIAKKKKTTAKNQGTSDSYKPPAFEEKRRSAISNKGLPSVGVSDSEGVTTSASGSDDNDNYISGNKRQSSAVNKNNHQNKRSKNDDANNNPLTVAARQLGQRSAGNKTEKVASTSVKEQQKLTKTQRQFVQNFGGEIHEDIIPQKEVSSKSSEQSIISPKFPEHREMTTKDSNDKNINPTDPSVSRKTGEASKAGKEIVTVMRNGMQMLPVLTVYKDRTGRMSYNELGDVIKVNMTLRKDGTFIEIPPIVQALKDSSGVIHHNSLSSSSSSSWRQVQAYSKTDGTLKELPPLLQIYRAYKDPSGVISYNSSVANSSIVYAYSKPDGTIIEYLPKINNIQSPQLGSREFKDKNSTVAVASLSANKDSQAKKFAVTENNSSLDSGANRDSITRKRMLQRSQNLVDDNDIYNNLITAIRNNDLERFEILLDKWSPNKKGPKGSTITFELLASRSHSYGNEVSSTSRMKLIVHALSKGYIVEFGADNLKILINKDSSYNKEEQNFLCKLIDDFFSPNSTLKFKETPNYPKRDKRMVDMRRDVSVSPTDPSVSRKTGEASKAGKEIVSVMLNGRRMLPVLKAYKDRTGRISYNELGDVIKVNMTLRKDGTFMEMPPIVQALKDPSGVIHHNSPSSSSSSSWRPVQACSKDGTMRELPPLLQIYRAYKDPSGVISYNSSANSSRVIAYPKQDGTLEELSKINNIQSPQLGSREFKDKNSTVAVASSSGNKDSQAEKFAVTENNSSLDSGATIASINRRRMLQKSQNIVGDNNIYKNLISVIKSNDLERFEILLDKWSPNKKGPKGNTITFELFSNSSKSYNSEASSTSRMKLIVHALSKGYIVESGEDQLKTLIKTGSSYNQEEQNFLFKLIDNFFAPNSTLEFKETPDYPKRDKRIVAMRRNVFVSHTDPAVSGEVGEVGEETVTVMLNGRRMLPVLTAYKDPIGRISYNALGGISKVNMILQKDGTFMEMPPIVQALKDLSGVIHHNSPSSSSSSSWRPVQACSKPDGTLRELPPLLEIYRAYKDPSGVININPSANSSIVNAYSKSDGTLGELSKLNNIQSQQLNNQDRSFTRRLQEYREKPQEKSPKK